MSKIGINVLNSLFVVTRILNFPVYPSIADSSFLGGKVV